MDALSIVGSVTALISVSNTLISTLYDIDRIRRSATQSTGQPDSLWHSYRGLEQAIEPLKDALEHLEDRSKACARMLSLQSDVESTCWQLVRSKESQGWLTREADSRRWEYMKSLDGACTKLMHCVQSDDIKPDSVFWKLQRWIMRLGEKTLLSVRIRLPEAIRRPSPTLLLVTWVLTALAVVAYYEAQPGHSYRTAFLLGGVFIATIVGVTEGSSADTIILTNVPWCIALGILMDALMYSLVGGKSRKSREKDLLSTRGQYCGTEKAILS